MKHYLVGIAVIAAISTSGVGMAAPTEQLPFIQTAHTHTDLLASNFVHLSKKKQQHIAHNFGLTLKEYQQYRYDMTYTPDRYFYALDTSPLNVLAAHAIDHPAQFKHYIKQAVKIAYRETNNMLTVSRAFSKEAHRQHPNEFPIMTPQMRARALQAGDTLRLFCRVGSATCSNILPIIIGRVQAVSGSRLDIFLVGNVTKAQIQEFAANNQIPIQLVMRHTISLNFGNYAFSAQSKEAGHRLPLPYLMAKRDGGAVMVNLTKGGVS